MAVRIEKDLSDQLRGSWLKAVAAIELHNLDYAIDLLQNLLKEEPEFLTGRRMLRRAEITRARTEKKGGFHLSGAPLAVMKAQRELKKDPLKAIESIEKVLESGPYNPKANMILKDAAVAANFPEIAFFAMETLLEKDAKDVKVLHELGRLYRQYEQSDKAVEIYNRISEIVPTDLEANKLGKDASAHASIKEGGWAKAESYRDLIKDKEVAVSLERQSRMQCGEESLEEQINETFGRHEREPQSVELARRLGLLHDQKEDLDGAIAWYQYAVDLTNKNDPGLVRKVADLKIKQIAQQILEEERYLTGRGQNDARFAEKMAHLEAAKKKRTEILIEDARKRLDRNPTDLQLRYELGEQLTNAGEYRDALPELQRARQNLGARLKAMNLLGRCYRKLGMLDLAAKQLEDAARETTVMESVGKEIVYNLGLVFEEMGDAAKVYRCDEENLRGRLRLP